ncbi:hypothetical protein OC861_003424 [Tilletia horrida]|nr:hypothetical protein OC861_003424 [Tilletia horrida]
MASNPPSSSSTFGPSTQNATDEQNPTTNPYANHPQLSATEAALLFEYHKLAATMKRIQEISYPLTSPATHATLLQSIRVLERKMGLILTLFKASVWSLLVERQDAAEAEAAAAAMAAHQAGSIDPYRPPISS